MQVRIRRLHIEYDQVFEPVKKYCWREIPWEDILTYTHKILKTITLCMISYIMKLHINYQNLYYATGVYYSST